MSVPSAQELREAIVQALPMETSTYGGTPDKKTVYVPPSHVKALRLECNLVIGARGVGKTFWSAALRSDAIRDVLGRSIPDLSNVRFHTGYSESPETNAYPDPDVFGNLLSKGYEAYHVWRAVMARWLAGLAGQNLPIDSWEQTVEWVIHNPEGLARLCEQVDAALGREGAYGLIVFDALDRSSTDWRTMDSIIRDLLRMILFLKRFPRLHGKVFLREDQFTGRRITDFPDASKLLATRVDLNWGANDLHGLLWQYLCNADHAGSELRRFFEDAAQHNLVHTSDIWTIPEVAKRDETIQRRLFSGLAGDWMGNDRRRGVPYVWSVSHLADGRGLTSPRSFLAAIRAAAEDSTTRYPEYTLALHYESIKQGVQKASEIRVSELSEDYPWVRSLMEPLRGLTVPCPFEAVSDRWQADPGMTATLSSERLPPEHHELGWPGLRRDLESLGLFESMKDGRVNMPDLYRVGFGLGRRGGVKPIPRS